MEGAVEDVKRRMLAGLEAGGLPLPAFLGIVADVSADRDVPAEALLDAVRLALGDRFRIVPASP
jgi:hypothetical protein